MFIDYLLRVSEAEAGAVALCGEEWHEEIPRLLLGHAVATIADR